jgi:hypothetical protein
MDQYLMHSPIPSTDFQTHEFRQIVENERKDRKEKIKNKLSFGTSIRELKILYDECQLLKGLREEKEPIQAVLMDKRASDEDLPVSVNVDRLIFACESSKYINRWLIFFRVGQSRIYPTPSRNSSKTTLTDDLYGLHNLNSGVEITKSFNFECEHDPMKASMRLRADFYGIDPQLLIFRLWPEISSTVLSSLFPMTLARIMEEYGDRSVRAYTVIM